MSNLQVKNVPDDLYDRLKRHARRQRRTLSDIVLQALDRELSRAEFHERLETRPQTELGVSAAALLEEERQQRAEQLTR